MKKRLRIYYEQCFKNNVNNLKNMERHKEIDTLKNSSTSKVYMLIHKGATVTGPFHISNAFNDYFSSVAEKKTSSKLRDLIHSSYRCT